MKPGKERDGAVAPLLPEVRPDEEETSEVGASISGAIMNLSTGMVGAGIMSIPATFKVVGVIPGLIIILIVAFFVEVTVEFLLRYTQHSAGEVTTYGGLMAESFGKIGSVALQLCVLITNLGALIVYLIIIGDVLSGNQSEGSLHLGILQEWFGVHWWNARAYSLLFVVLFVMLPLLLLRRVDSLRHASAVSILLALLFVVICSGMAIYAMWQGKTQTPRLVPDFSKVSFFDLFTTIPVFATSLGCHVTVHPVRAELGRPSDMGSAVRMALTLAVGIYFTVGFFGYLLFGESIMADILVNFDLDSNSTFGTILNDIIRISYAIHLMLVFPVMNYSFRSNADELIFSEKQTPLSSDTTRFVSLTCISLAIMYMMAISVPNIWYFFQFMGTTTVMCIMFIFPCSIILRDVHGISSRSDRVMATVVIFLAVGTSFFAISTNVYTYILNK